MRLIERLVSMRKDPEPSASAELLQIASTGLSAHAGLGLTQTSFTQDFYGNFNVSQNGNHVGTMQHDYYGNWNFTGL